MAGAPLAHLHQVAPGWLIEIPEIEKLVFRRDSEKHRSPPSAQHFSPSSSSGQTCTTLSVHALHLVVKFTRSSQQSSPNSQTPTNTTTCLELCLKVMQVSLQSSCSGPMLAMRRARAPPPKQSLGNAHVPCTCDAIHRVAFTLLVSSGGCRTTFNTSLNATSSCLLKLLARNIKAGMRGSTSLQDRCVASSGCLCV